MTKLEKLNPAQEKLMYQVKDEWIKFCLGGDTSINRQLAMDGIRWIYGLAKLDSPLVIFVGGPMECQMAVHFLMAMFKDKKMQFDQVWDQVWDQVRDQVRDQVWDQVRDQVRDQVGDQVRDQLNY